MPESSDFKRMPAVERAVSDITPQDIRVRVTGTVLDKQGDRIVLDDGTGKINVNFSQPVETEPQKLVRVFGKVISVESGFELEGEIIQDMSGLDLGLWKKVREKESQT